MRLAVTDSGLGIPRGDLRRVFEPFYTSDGRRGSGLGLAIASELAERMGGRLTAESVPGRTTFTLAIPGLTPASALRPGDATPAGSLPRVLQPVHVAHKSLADYTHLAGRELVEEVRALAEPLTGLRVSHISATAFGGGVRELLARSCC